MGLEPFRVRVVQGGFLCGAELEGGALREGWVLKSASVLCCVCVLKSGFGTGGL